MRVSKWLALVVGLTLGGCVSQTEFNAYKAEMEVYKAKIKHDGEAVDTWIATAHEVVKWVSVNGGTFCPSCDPPAAPPNPPPDGGWGT